jgi:hypothetical protein
VHVQACRQKQQGTLCLHVAIINAYQVLNVTHCCCCRLLGNKLMGRTKLCKPGSHAYDEKMSAQVWEASAEFAGVPVQPQV